MGRATSLSALNLELPTVSSTIHQNATQQELEPPQKCAYESLSQVRSLILTKLSNLPHKTRLHFDLLNGPPPEDAGALSFWVAHLLPVGEYKKYKLLGMDSVKKRIVAVLGLLDEDGGLKVLVGVGSMSIGVGGGGGDSSVLGEGESGSSCLLM